MVAAPLSSRRTSIMIAIWVAVVLGGLFVLFLSSQNSAQFGRLQPWILLASAVAVAVLIVLLARKVVQLVAAYRSGVPGSRLTSRTVIVFGALVAVPLLTVYLFSLEFLNRGIDSWFRIEIKQGLNDAVVLSRSALDLRMREHAERTQRFAATLAARSGEGVLFLLEDELRDSTASEIVLYGEHERIISAASRSVADALPARPPPDLVRRVNNGETYVSLEPIADSQYIVRTAAALPGAPLATGDARFVVVIHELPRQLAELTDAVQRSYSQYGDLAALREPLKYSFRLTLTMVLLVTLLGAIYGAIYSAEVLFKPVQDLMAGTRAVAKGDFGTRVPLTSRDEMGFLVQSFNDMTKRLRRAREETESSRAAVERERERLAIILARLSAGVITVDRSLTVQRANESAGSILGIDVGAAIGKVLGTLSAAENGFLPSFVEEIRAKFAAGRDEWREQIELKAAVGKTGTRVLVCACVPLPQEAGDPEQFVIVFDDVTHLLQAQRDGAVVIDTREPMDFATGHLVGSINVGLSGRFAEYTGEVVTSDTPLVLLCPEGTEAEARVRLARIGFDKVLGALRTPEKLFMDRPDLVGKASRLTVEQLKASRVEVSGLQVVDVRGPGEVAAGIVPGSKHVQLPSLINDYTTLDPTAPTVIYCAGGYRSSIAASFLRLRGFTDVSDLLGGFGAWSQAGEEVAVAAPAH